jgi:hypothetical protein
MDKEWFRVNFDSIISSFSKIFLNPLSNRVWRKSFRDQEGHSAMPRQENWLGPLLYIGNYVYCEQKDGGAGYLLFGGMLLGDTFHTIPLLNWMIGERQRSKIVWWSGTYERPAVEFLRKLYPIEASYFKDGVPLLREDRDKFINNQLPRLMKVLKKVSWEVVHFDSKNNKNFALKETERLGAVPGNFLVIHSSSRHSWKNIPAMHALDWRQFDLPLVTVGGSGEPLIPGTLDFRGRPFFEVAQLLASARLVVGIHSSISCLALYLDQPLIVCSPEQDPAYARFSELRPQIVNLVQPTEIELIETVSRCLQESELWSSRRLYESGGQQQGQHRQISQALQLGVNLHTRPRKSINWWGFLRLRELYAGVRSLLMALAKRTMGCFKK